MNTKTNTLIATLVACFLAFTACDDKHDDPKSPEFAELKLDKTTCSPGETIKATATIKTEGAYYYYYRIYYTVGSVTNIIEKADFNTKTGAIEFSFIAPSNEGIYHVSMKASVSYTSQGKLYGETNTVGATLTVEEG